MIGGDDRPEMERRIAALEARVAMLESQKGYIIEARGDSYDTEEQIRKAVADLRKRGIT